MSKSERPSKESQRAQLAALRELPGIVTDEEGGPFKLPNHEDSEQRYFDGESSALDDLIYLCSPTADKEHEFRERLLAAVEEAHAQGYVAAKREMSENPGTEVRLLREDRARLNWLENCRRALNAHCKSAYGWVLVRSHNVNRIMVRSPYHGEMAAVDLNDAASGGKDIRQAIDEGMRLSSIGTDDAPTASVGTGSCPACGRSA